MNTKPTATQIIKLSAPYLLIFSAFILCSALGMLLEPKAFYKFFSILKFIPATLPETRTFGYYIDVEHYANMALNNNCMAFYPLWPFIIRNLFHPRTTHEAAYWFFLGSILIFFISIFPLYHLFKKTFKKSSLALILVSAYAINPTSIFHVIGYTESLFSLLTIGFIWTYLYIENFNTKLALIFILTLIMSLTRPILIQVLFASGASLATIIVFEAVELPNFSWKEVFSQINQYIKHIYLTIALCSSAIIGYSLYGIFCLKTRGDFLAPFHDQKIWGKKFGIHLELLLGAKSFLFDLLGLFIPILILLLSLTFVYFKVIGKNPKVFIPKSDWWIVLIMYPPLLILWYLFNYFKLKFKKINLSASLKPLITRYYTKKLSKNYIFWFSIYFAVANSIIVFFTQDKLASLARYIFAIPFIFMAIGYFYCCLPGKTYKALWFLTFVSAIDLVQQWIRFGNDGWLG